MLVKTLFVLIFGLILLFEIKAQTHPIVNCEPQETSFDSCKKHTLKRDTSNVFIKVYTKAKPSKIIDRTFVIVHANEKNGLEAAKKVISENYGRLVEIVANSPSDPDSSISLKRERYLYFSDGKCIDPNRIYTVEGIRKTLKDPDKPCGTITANEDLVKSIGGFTTEFIKIVTNNFTHRFIIGVHNNDYSLSPNTWSKDGDEAKTAFGIFLANDHLQSDVLPTSSHNFILATNGKLFGKLLDSGINSVALQEGRDYLTVIDSNSRKRTIKKELDDGSMSIYFGASRLGVPAKVFDYINIEAGGKNDDNVDNKKWQKAIIKKIIDVKL